MLGAKVVQDNLDTVYLEGEVELESRCSHNLHLGISWLHDDAAHVTYGMVVGEEVLQLHPSFRGGLMLIT